MGWRFRRSVKLPLGFRLNFSKSGMGWSWGVKGARVTKMAIGKQRTPYFRPSVPLLLPTCYQPLFQKPKEIFPQKLNKNPLLAVDN